MKRPLLLLALLSLSLAAGATRSAPFRPPRVVDLGEGHTPIALAAGDFDRDGKLDLVVGSEGADDVILFSGDGRGGFRRRGAFPAGPQPTEIAVADFNRDGLLDLAIANHGIPLVTILLGDGRGGFRPAPGSPLSVRSKPHPHTIAACDADGDGILDLVIDSFEEKRFTFLRGNGRGGFATPGASIEAGRTPYRNLQLVDLDGDGRCDLVATNLAARGVTVLLGDGRGGFHGAENPSIPAGPAPFSVAIGNLNRDGKPDLAVANYSGQITDSSRDGLTFLLNEGHGRFRLGGKIATGRGSGHVATGDVDGDGYADAVTANAGSGDITVA
ncbi:MAG: VCBS repeat-containing protein, partial [Acidobacteriota bacterium]|nr:VCBS repeat-containing protein [Acidobacteriota bacterium]